MEITHHDVPAPPQGHHKYDDQFYVTIGCHCNLQKRTRSTSSITFLEEMKGHIECNLYRTEISPNKPLNQWSKFPRIKVRIMGKKSNVRGIKAVIQYPKKQQHWQNESHSYANNLPKEPVINKL